MKHRTKAGKTGLGQMPTSPGAKSKTAAAVLNTAKHKHGLLR
jgi:hypothetical protein